VIVAEMKAAGGSLHHFLHLKATKHIGSLLSLDPDQINMAEIERRHPYRVSGKRGKKPRLQAAVARKWQSNRIGL
jgi:hypothetical protein